MPKWWRSARGRCNVPERKHEPPSDLIPLGREGHANVDRYNLLRTPVRSVRRLDVQIRPQSPEGVQNGNNSDIQGDSPWTEDEYPGLRTAISMRVLDSSKQLFDTSDPSAVQNRPSRTCLEVFAAQGSRTQSKRAGISEGEKRSRTSSRSSSVVEKNSQQNARRTQKSHARCQINYGHNASEDFNSRKLMTCCVGMEKAMRTKNQKFPKTSSGEAKRSIGMKHSRMRGWTRALSPPPTNNLRGRLEVQAHFAKTKHRNYERSRSPKNDERYVTPLDRAPSKTYGTRDTIETCVRRERNKTLGSLALSQTSISQERGRSHERCTASKTSLSCNRCKGPVYLERSKSGTNRTPRKTGTRRSRVQLSSSSEDLATEKELSRKRGRPHSKVSNATSDPPEFRCTAEQESPRKCARSLNKTFIALSDVPEFRCTTEKVPFRKCQRSLNKTFTALSDLPGRQRAAEKELSRKRRQSLNKTFTASSDLPEIQRATERESSKKRQRSLNKAFTASSDLPELRHATERGSSIKHRRSRSKASTDSSDGSQFYETIAERAMLNRRLSTQRSHPELKSCSRDESKNGKKLNDSGARPGAKKMMEDLPKMVSDEMAKQRGHSKKMSSSNHCLSRKRSDAIQNPMAETSSNLSKRKGHQDGTLGEARKYKSTCSSSEIEDEFVVTKERADQDEHFFRKIFRAMWNNIMVAWKEKRKQCMNHDNDYGLCRCNMLIADAFWSGSDEDEDNGQTKQDGRHGTDEHEQIPTQTDQATSRAQEAVERARVRVGEVAGRLQSVQGTTRRRMDARRRFLKQAEQAARDEEAIRNMQHAEALFSSQQMMQEEASSEMSDNSDVRLNGDPSGIVQWSAPAANGFTAGDDILRDPRRVQKRVCVESQASNFIGVFEGPARIEPALPGDKQQLSDDSREQDSASVTTIYVEDRAKPNHATTIEECLRAQLTNGSEVCLSGDSEEVGNVSEQWRSSFIQHAVSTSGAMKNPLYYPWDLAQHLGSFVQRKRKRTCRLCRNHGLVVDAHARSRCSWRECTCEKCQKVFRRRLERTSAEDSINEKDSESTVGSRSTISGDSDEVRDEILSASDSTNDDGARIDEPKNVQENSARFVTRAEDSVISEQSRAAPITQRAESPLPQSQLATSKLQSILGDDAIARLSDCEVTSQAQKAVPWNESLFRGVVREYETLLPPPSPAIGLIESSSRPDSPTEAKTATFSVSSFCTCNKSNTTESDIFLNGADIQKSALPSATAVSRRTAQRAPFQPPTQSPMAVPESTWWPEQSVAANSAQLVQQQPVCTGNESNITGRREFLSDGDIHKTAWPSARSTHQYAPLPPPPQPPIVVPGSTWCPEQSILANSAQLAHPQATYTGNESNFTERYAFLNGGDIHKTALPSAAAVCPRTAPQYAPLPPQPQPPIVVQESMWCREQSILANSAQFAYPQPIYTGYGSSVTERNVILSDRDTRKTALPSTAAVSRRTAQYAPLPPPSQSPMVASESAWWPEQSIAANSAQLVQQHPVCTANRFAPDCGPSCMNIAAQVPLHLTARFAVRQQEVQGPGSWQSSQTVGHASGPAYSAKQFQYGKYPPLHAAPPQPMPSTVRPINSAYSSSGHMANSYQPVVPTAMYGPSQCINL